MEEKYEYENFYKKDDIFSYFSVKIKIGENNLIINVRNLSEYSMRKEYKKTITLKDFQNVKYFIMYDSIKECFYDIFKPNETKNIII